jgi:hypothetical protein
MISPSIHFYILCITTASKSGKDVGCKAIIWQVPLLLGVAEDVRSKAFGVNE